jgi:hypothetical protein
VSACWEHWHLTSFVLFITLRYIGENNLLSMDGFELPDTIGTLYGIALYDRPRSVYRVGMNFHHTNCGPFLDAATSL